MSTNTKTIRVADLVSACDTNDQGAVLQDAIRSALDAGQDVQVDFAGVANITTSFANTGLFDLVPALGLDQFKARIAVANATKQIGDLLRWRMSRISA